MAEDDRGIAPRAQAVAFLDGLIDRERTPSPVRRADLDRMTRLDRALGAPWSRYPAIHVGGTKGKGSIVRMAEALLEAGGIATGAFLSPHLVRVEERIRIRGRPIEGEAFAAAVEAVRRAARSLPSAPSYFEALAAAAMVAFARARVEVAILEVGLGGRLDATNVVRPEVSVIASIGLEHTHLLGGDIAAIAGEKAGIAKAEVPLVVGPVPRRARRAIARRAREVGAPLLAWGREIRTRSRGPGFDVLLDGPGRRRSWPDLRLAAWGIPQRFNAALALAATSLVPGVAPPPARRARRVLARLIIPGRLQLVEGRPALLVDGAHTREAAIALAREVDARLAGRRRALLLCLARDKDLDGMLPALARVARRAVTTRVYPPRQRDPKALAAALRAAGIEAEPELDPRRALERARELATPEGIVCVTGSLYLAGEVLRLCGLEDA